MKKCFIGMSINKQLYFGILGICFLFFLLNLLLIFLSSLKLFFHYNDNIKETYNSLDTNIVSLNSENADIFSQLLLYQGKYETYFYRVYYNILSSETNDIGNDLISTINIDEDELNKYFIFSDNLKSETDNNCKSNQGKCYFVFGERIGINIRKKLYILIPTIDISLDTYAFHKENLKIFNRFNLYENNAYISYKNNITDIINNFDEDIQNDKINENIISYIKNRAPLIEELNEIKIEDLTYKQFFDENIIILFLQKVNSLVIDPFNDNGEQNFYFASILFNEDLEAEKVDITKLDSNKIKNYITFDIKLNILSYLILYFIKLHGNYIFTLGNDRISSSSKSICRLNDYFNNIYSDESINGNLNLTIDYLNIKELQSENISDCLTDPDILKIALSDENYNYKLKILYDMHEYNYSKDINNKIQVKILRELAPNKYITSFLNLQFYHSFSYYFLVFKFYNNIYIFSNLIDRILYRQVSYIMLFVFALWVVIFIYVMIKLFLVTDRISSPIRKLIKNISLSQANFSSEELKSEQIYYDEDKDINDLFQLCQNLILGGFKKKINSQKKSKINVYNNVSMVKTNNVAINENKIIIQRNEKYNEIFEKGEDKEKINDTFKKDIYFKYKTKDFDNKIKHYESKKLKKLVNEKKEEIEKIKNKDNEYKMFYYINREIEGFMPSNNLYRFYYEKFRKKSNKKK